MILSCSNICKSFGENDILKQVSFHIEDHEKAAIVGINGAGKSTLLKVLIGKLAADDGVVTWAKGASIGYLAQHQDLEGAETIYDALLEVKKPVIQMSGLNEKSECDYGTIVAVSLENKKDYWTKVKLDEKEIKNLTNKISFKKLEPGIHVLKLQAKDAAGNLICPNGRKFLFKRKQHVRYKKYGRTEEIYPSLLSVPFLQMKEKGSVFH